LLGWLDQSPAAAEWDGRRLRVSQTLFDMAVLALRIGHIFAGVGQFESGHVASLPGRLLVPS
jgi:hypothetical protein